MQLLSSVLSVVWSPSKPLQSCASVPATVAAVHVVVAAAAVATAVASVGTPDDISDASCGEGSVVFLCVEWHACRAASRRLQVRAEGGASREHQREARKKRWVHTV